MAFEISRPMQFLPQPTFIKEDSYGDMDFAHLKQQQNSSSAYDNDTSDKSSLGTEVPYISYAPASSPYYHGSSSAPLATSHTPSSNQFGTYSTELGLSVSPLSSPPPLPAPRKRDDGIQQHHNGLLSPLPTNTSIYESHFTQHAGADVKVLSTPPINDMIHPQNYMMWKQDLYSPPLPTSNTSWTQQQQQEEAHIGATAGSPTPKSLSGSPPLHYRNSMVPSNNMPPPCNCIPMIQYDPIYNHPETLPMPPPPPYHDSSALTFGSSPPLHSGMYSDLANRNNSKIMGYSHRSQQQHQQRSSMDQSYQHPSLDLSPSSSSSLSDDYSQHLHQQRHSMNSNSTGTNTIKPSSSSSSSSSSSNTTGTVNASTPRRYKCTVCVKRFTRPSSLATHMHSHTGEKPYKCLMDGCGRRFSVVSNLRRHAKIHLNATSMVGSGRKLHLA